jgi:catechol 2,3-dioxygenase-like lactoylglutathione lyase family enzyme
MQQRVSLITLGVSDLERARAFYEALGWRSRADPGADVVFFQTGGSVLALWDRDALGADSGVEPGGAGFGGIVLAHNVGSPEEVEEIVTQAATAGANVTRAPGETFWGGYSGVFVDPDGHPWEIAHNPRWALDGAGNVTLPQ